jgi:hypothetical protein
MQDAGDNTYSIAVWMYPTSSATMAIASTVNSSGGTSGAGLLVSSTPTVYFNKVGVLDFSYAYTYLNKWSYIVFVQNTSGMYMYLNGSEVANNTNTANIVLSQNMFASIGRRTINAGSDFQYYGYMDELAIYGRALNGTEISQLYNGGMGYNPFFINPDVTGFNNISSQIYGSSKLSGFDLRFSNPALFNVSFEQSTFVGFGSQLAPSSDGLYINNTACASGTSCGISFANTSLASLEFVYKMMQSPADGLYYVYADGQQVLNFTSSPVGTEVKYQLFFNQTVRNVTFSCSGVSVLNSCFPNASYFRNLNATYQYSTTNGTVFLPKFHTAINNFSVFSFSNSSLLNLTYTSYNLSSNLTIPYTVLTVNGSNIITGFPVENYTLSVNSSEFPLRNATQIAINRTSVFYVQNNLTLYATGSKVGFVTNTTSIISYPFGVVNYSYLFYPNNSIVLRFFNSSNLALLSSTLVSISLTGSGNVSYFNTTSNGSLFLEGLAPDTYTLEAVATGFSDFTGVVTVGSNTYQTLDVYMPPPSLSNVLFTIYDFSGGQPITGAQLYTEYKPSLNSSYVYIGTLTSDVTGTISLNYATGTPYRFTLSAPLYQTRQFELDPIIFSTYDITITRNVTVNYTDDFQGITVTASPGVFYNNNETNATFYVASPLGLLQGFNYSIWSDANTTRSQGFTTDLYGATLIQPYFTNSTQRGQNVYIEYTYYLTDGTTKTFLRVYPIIDYNLYTFNQVREADGYGLSLFDRVVIMTFTLLLGAGFAFAFGGEVVGGFIGAMILTYFFFIGFIPLWFSSIPIALILWYIWGRS